MARPTSSQQQDASRSTKRRRDEGQEQEQRKRRALNKSGGHTGDESVAEASASQGPVDDDAYQDYLEAMRLAADNKITDKNAWSLKTIDHMQDLMDMFEPAEGGAQRIFDFHRAALLLEACVKIHTCRVDDTWKQTYAVLSNFSYWTKEKQSRKRGEEGENEEEEEDSEHPHRDKRKRRRRKKPQVSKSRITKTLETDGPEVEPLRTERARFLDEQGAKGLLGVKLGLYSGVGQNLLEEEVEWRTNLLLETLRRAMVVDGTKRKEREGRREQEEDHGRGTGGGAGEEGASGETPGEMDKSVGESAEDMDREGEKTREEEGGVKEEVVEIGAGLRGESEGEEEDKETEAEMERLEMSVPSVRVADLGSLLALDCVSGAMDERMEGVPELDPLEQTFETLRKEVEDEDREEEEEEAAEEMFHTPPPDRQRVASEDSEDGEHDGVDVDREDVSGFPPDSRQSGVADGDWTNTDDGTESAFERPMKETDLSSPSYMKDVMERVRSGGAWKSRRVYLRTPQKVKSGHKETDGGKKSKREKKTGVDFRKDRPAEIERGDAKQTEQTQVLRKQRQKRRMDHVLEWSARVSAEDAVRFLSFGGRVFFDRRAAAEGESDSFSFDGDGDGQAPSTPLLGEASQDGGGAEDASAPEREDFEFSLTPLGASQMEPMTPSQQTTQDAMDATPSLSRTKRRLTFAPASRYVNMKVLKKKLHSCVLELLDAAEADESSGEAGPTSILFSQVVERMRRQVASHVKVHLLFYAMLHVGVEHQFGMVQVASKDFFIYRSAEEVFGSSG